MTEAEHQAVLASVHCRSEGCSSSRELRVVHWPGQESMMCGDHWRQADRVAQVMGFTLATEPFESWFARLLEGARVRAAAMALGAEG